MTKEQLKWLQRNSLCYITRSTVSKELPVIGPYRIVMAHIQSGKPWQTCPINVSRQAFARILTEEFNL